MTLKIFYSWQSNSPNKTNRTFIEEALKRAIELVRNDIELEEAHRTEGIEIDMDTKGVPGSPPIVETIFKKISACTVFVADLTFIATTTEGDRKLPNPNVLIEYGWALNAIGHSRIIPIMNSAFFNPTPETLPFDIRHLRQPIKYNLPPEAEQPLRSRTKEELARTLTIAIKDIIRSIPIENPPAPALHKPTPSKYSPSSFLERGEKLVTKVDLVTEKRTDIRIWEDSHIYLRILPKNKQRTFLTVDLKEAYNSGKLFLLGARQAYIDENINKFGFVIFDAIGEPKTTRAVQLMTNGEIWAITDPYMEKKPLSDTVKPHHLEEFFERALEQFRTFAISALGLEPPFVWIAGATGIQGRELQLPPAPPGYVRPNDGGPRFEIDSLEESGVINADSDIKASLTPFFERIYGECGLRRADFVLPQSRSA